MPLCFLLKAGIVVGGATRSHCTVGHHDGDAEIMVPFAEDLEL